VPVLGVAFDTMTRNDAALAVANLSRTGSRAYVVKPYSEFLPAANRDPRVNEILNGAALCLADGVGIIWAAHYLSLPGGTVRALIQLPLSLGAMVVRPSAIRDPLPEAMAGVDLTWRMLEALAAAGSSVFLLGGTEDELGSTVSVLRERLPDLRIVGAKAGHFRMKGPANDDVIAAINAASPDALLVAMGFPRQEKWISTNIARLDVKVAVAEGGSFSFIGGKVSRAPAWMRRAGLEWLYRLGRQPWRLRRQLQLPVFVWLVVRERLRRPAAA
jgi:N-acetylglucosaminyldiphosphoundecaprenol N-acetyl-beta-D-mannosaminyltransferase